MTFQSEFAVLIEKVTCRAQAAKNGVRRAVGDSPRSGSANRSRCDRLTILHDAMMRTNTTWQQISEPENA